MSNPTALVTIENHHTAPPPPITNANYMGYFANEHGEQWLLWRDAGMGRVYLTGGDIDWIVHEITPAWFTAAFGEPGSCPLILEHEEQLWISACWRALHGTLLTVPQEERP